MKLFRKIALFLRSPQKGDVYYGNSKDYVIGKPMEAVLHGLRDKEGNPTWIPVPSTHSYKLVIKISATIPYYVCDTEVFCMNAKSMTPVYFEGNWMKRSQPRRIPKERLYQMIVDGLLKRSKV